MQAPEHLAASLFSHHFVQGLRGAADLDESGEITPAELLTYTAQRTVAEAAYDGLQQRPVFAGQAEVRLVAAGARGK